MFCCFKCLYFDFTLVSCVFSLMFVVVTIVFFFSPLFSFFSSLVSLAGGSRGAARRDLGQTRMSDEKNALLHEIYTWRCMRELR